MRGLEGARLVRGNCERDPDDRMRAKLGEEAVAWSSAWPATVELDGVLYCHATPESDERILTEDSPEASFDGVLAGYEHRLVVAGHTHIQEDRGVGRIRWVNAGSVGMPYEGDVAAFWALVGDDVEFRRTPFDVERAIHDIVASDWPGRDEFVAENLRSAPSRREAIEHFERVA